MFSVSIAVIHILLNNQICMLFILPGSVRASTEGAVCLATLSVSIVGCAVYEEVQMFQPKQKHSGSFYLLNLKVPLL